MKESRFEKLYPDLYQLLSASFAADADNDQFNEDITLDEYLYGPEMLEEAESTLIEAKKVLELKLFPEDLISSLTNITSPTETRKEWLVKVVRKLEEKVKEMESSVKRMDTKNKNQHKEAPRLGATK